MRLGSALKIFGHGAVLGLLYIWRELSDARSPMLSIREAEPDSAWRSYFHLAGRPVVHSHHATIPERVPIREAFVYRFGCRRIIAVAHSMKGDLVAGTGLSDSRIDVVGEGADLEEFHPGMDGGGFRAEFKIPPKSPCFWGDRDDAPRKGQRDFYRAAASPAVWLPDDSVRSSAGEEDLRRQTA